MTTHTTRPLRAALLVAMLAVLLIGVDAQEPAPIELPPISAIDLSPTLGIPSVAYGLNDIGSIVGYASLIPPAGSARFGFLLSAEAGMVNLGWGEDLVAYDVNNKDEAVGTRGSSYPATAMLWSKEDDEGPWTGRRIARGVAYAINDASTVVGVHAAPTGLYPVDHAFRWKPDEGLTDIESLTGLFPPWSYYAPLSEARSIRDDGLISGQRGGRAVIWLSTGDVNELLGDVVLAINDAGLAVGGDPTFNPATGAESGQPTIWRDGVAIPISERTGAAFDVNEAGYVVGRITVEGVRHAFVWHETLGLQDLGPGAAYAIDEAGRIAGHRTIDQTARATIWRLELPVEHLLVGLQTVARRLIDPRIGGGTDERVHRAIAAARAELTVGHEKAAGARLAQVTRALAKLEGASELAPARAKAIREIATELLVRLRTIE